MSIPKRIMAPIALLPAVYGSTLIILFYICYQLLSIVHGFDRDNFVISCTHIYVLIPDRRTQSKVFWNRVLGRKFEPKKEKVIFG